MNETGRKITELRTQQRLPQDEFADRIGVSRQTVSKWEVGQVEPSARNLKNICKIFNLPISYFFPTEEATESQETENNEIKDKNVVEKINPPAKKKKVWKKIVLIASMIIVGLVLILFLIAFIMVNISDNVDIGVQLYSFNIQALWILLFVSIGALIIAAVVIIIILFKKWRIKNGSKGKKK